MMAPLPVLYSFRRCPYAIRARLALASSGVQYELREVMLRNKPPALLSASPKGTVPILVLPSGTVIDESLDVMLWALRLNDPQGWLAVDAGQTLALIAENDGAFKSSLDRYKYPSRFAGEAAQSPLDFAATHRATGARWLASLEARLAHQAWLFGARASWADMAVLPFVRQFARTDLSWFAAQPWPCLQRWLSGFEASALFRQVMEKSEIRAGQP